MYYFAWVDPETPFNSVTHAVMDEDIFEYRRRLSEGDFALLTLVIANPGDGLLAGDRWAWFSERVGETVVPRFFGRIMGVPEGLQHEELTVTLVGRPLDFVDQKETLAATLRLDPQFWDPIFIDKGSLNDPDAALIARTADWHVDPVTHVVTISDKVSGEDGILEYGADDVFYEPTDLTYGAPPARRCEVTAEIRWTQSAAGQIDITSRVRNAFSIAGSPNPFMAATYNPSGLTDDWPTSGMNIGRGWNVADAEAIDKTSRVVSDAQAAQYRITAFASSYGAGTVGAEPPVAVDFNLALIEPKVIAGYDVKRSYTEIVTLTLEADVQAVVTDVGDQEAIVLSFSSNDVSEPVDPEDTSGAGVPIGDVRRRSYMLTDRGHDSLKFLIARARAELIDRARCAEIPFQIDYAHVGDISLRKSVSLTDPRLPGGAAQGKIIFAEDAGNGDSGEFTLSISIACCVGNGGSAIAAAGSPTYVADGYVSNGYQTREGATILVAGDVTFTDYGQITPNDDGLGLLTLTAASAVEFAMVTNGPTAQANAIGEFYPDVGSAVSALEDVSTTMCLDLKPLTGGPFETQFPITVSDLVIPKGIDLAAPGGP